MALHCAEGGGPEAVVNCSDKLAFSVVYISHDGKPILAPSLFLSVCQSVDRSDADGGDILKPVPVEQIDIYLHRQ